jgi:arylsulfatase A-like enzyme
VVLLGEKRIAPGLIDVRGFLADGSIGLVVVGVVGLCLASRRAWGRLLAGMVAVAFVVMTFGIYEFISAFDSLYALSQARFLLDATFVGGSVRHMAHPFLLGAMVATVTFGAAFAEVPGRAWWGCWGAGAIACTLGQVALPMSHLHDGWRQRHALHAQASVLPVTSRFGANAVGAEVWDAFNSDLDGEHRFAPLKGRANVILIMLEAASGAVLPSLAIDGGIEASAAMPKLDARAKDHLFFTRVVAHQRQTNRGEYAILCGDYPKLLTDQSKMTEQVYGHAARCLPEVLRESGYATAYLQAAPLAFMLKDQFMPRAGFDEVIGDEWFTKSYGRTDWGVDDRAFFEQAIEKVDELHRADAPFFLTLLTVGTHHPYTLPPVSGETAKERRERAFAWADDGLDGFLDSLDERGVLQDTVVIVTSDESAGWVETESPTERLLAQSWSFAIVMLPEPRSSRVDTLYAQVDTALSVLDLLGMTDERNPFIGRSWFRKYESPRPLFAGNTYARRVIMWEPTEDTVVCDETFRACRRFETGPGGPFIPNGAGTPAPSRERRLVEEVARLTRSGRFDLSSVQGLRLIGSDEVRVRSSEGRKLLVGGQYLRVPGGSVVRVDFDLELSGIDAVVDFHQDVFVDGLERFARKGTRLREGERWLLRYELPVRAPSSHLVIQLYATASSGEDAAIRFHDAQAAIERMDPPSNEVVVIEDRLTPGTLR